jgi:hypothetical protein
MGTMRCGYGPSTEPTRIIGNQRRTVILASGRQDHSVEAKLDAGLTNATHIELVFIRSVDLFKSTIDSKILHKCGGWMSLANVQPSLVDSDR